MNIFSHLNKVALHLEAGDEDLAAIVARHLALLDQRDRRYQSLNCRGKFAICSILNIQFNEKKSSNIYTVLT